MDPSSVVFKISICSTDNDSLVKDPLLMQFDKIFPVFGNH
jgi:hypothetical protein